MDVVVTRVEDDSAWWLTDRSGHSLGAIREESGSGTVTIVAKPESRLQGVEAHHASLNGALKAIADHLGGTCKINPDVQG